jgi:DNA-binding response OmpR family regulator
VRLDEETRVLMLGDKAMPLMQGEFKLLRCLMARRGRTVPTDDLREAVYGLDAEWGGVSALRAIVMTTRKKVRRLNRMFDIRVDYGIGYYAVFGQDFVR